jgi:hypothetical protein
MAEAKKRLVYGKDDALFGAVENHQGEKPFGTFLDAGTGLHSLRWISTLNLQSFTAITADKAMQRKVQNEANALGVSNLGKVIIGNWFGEAPPIQPDEQYDTILADYLIGAMDGFSPYQVRKILSFYE